MQKKTCRNKQHVRIDNIWEMPDLICGKTAVGGNYNSTRYSKQSGERPCLVVSNTRNNIVSTVMTVCPITTKIRKNPVHISITQDDVQGYFPKDSDVMVEQLTVVDKKDVMFKYGYAKPEFMEQVNETVCRHLGLTDYFEDKAGDPT